MISLYNTVSSEHRWNNSSNIWISSSYSYSHKTPNLCPSINCFSGISIYTYTKAVSSFTQPISCLKRSPCSFSHISCHIICSSCKSTNNTSCSDSPSRSNYCLSQSCGSSYHRGTCSYNGCSNYNSCCRGNCSRSRCQQSQISCLLSIRFSKIVGDSDSLLIYRRVF